MIRSIVQERRQQQSQWTKVSQRRLVSCRPTYSQTVFMNDISREEGTENDTVAVEHAQQRAA